MGWTRNIVLLDEAFDDVSSSLGDKTGSNTGPNIDEADDVALMGGTAAGWSFGWFNSDVEISCTGVDRPDVVEDSLFPLWALDFFLADRFFFFFEAAGAADPEVVVGAAFAEDDVRW